MKLSPQQIDRLHRKLAQARKNKGHARNFIAGCGKPWRRYCYWLNVCIDIRRKLRRAEHPVQRAPDTFQDWTEACST